MEVHQRIKKTRSKLGLSQENIAEFLNISQPAYNKLEAGKSKFNVDQLKTIAHEFGMQVSELISDHEAVKMEQVSNNQQVNGINISGILESQERAVYEKHIAHLEEEVKFLRQQLNAILASKGV